MTPFEKAFQDLVKDMYNAEKQVLKALPKAAKAATSPELKAGIEEHREQTEGHVTRLQQVAELGEFRPSGKVCAAATGIIEEMTEAIDEHPKGPVLDAVLVCGCQKFEHYEIANYGTAVAWAKLLGKEDAAKLLEETLNEEVDTNDKLTELADGSVNKSAVSALEEAKSSK
jgi:ferritin-like metal-binding protein YciE